MLVAVYGTLKQGHKNNPGYLDGLQPLHARFVDIPIRMYEGAEYPMIVPSGEVAWLSFCGNFRAQAIVSGENE